MCTDCVNCFEAEYELLGVDPDGQMPPRSVLLPLKPKGWGTSRRESLSSYFQRLAASHCVQPRLLAREYILPRLNLGRAVEQTQADRFWNSPFFNGMGEVPLAWARILGELTQIKELERLTLLPMQGLLGLQGLSPHRRKWCPLCLHHGVECGDPYGLLLWEIGCVKACPEHRIKLVATCGCELSSGLHPLRVKFLPHLCHRCGRNLAQLPEAKLEPAEVDDVEIAETVAKLLGSQLYERRHPGDDSSSTVADFLNEVVKMVGYGNAARVAFRLEVSKGGFSEWCRKLHIPSLPQVVHIARYFHRPLSQILVGEGKENLWDYLGHPNLERYGNTVGKVKAPNHLARDIQAFLEVEPPLSMAAVSEVLMKHPRQLYAAAPEMCKAIAVRYKEYRAGETIKRRNEGLAVVRELASEMLHEGITPTMKRLEARIEGKLPKSFLFKERIHCRKICFEVRE